MTALTADQRRILAALANGPRRATDADLLRGLYALRERGYVEVTMPRHVMLWQLTARGKEALREEGEGC